MFGEYIELGTDHILNIRGIDHILYVATLCSLYFITEWRKILWLVTAFTLGHCITLGLSAFRVVNITPSLVETLIPITIIISACYNIYVKLRSVENKISTTNHYILTLVFGLIHGLGFSNYFKEMFSPDESIFLPLLGFNIGVELGQLVIVAMVVGLSYIISRVGSRALYYWTIGLSAAIILWAIKILLHL